MAGGYPCRKTKLLSVDAGGRREMVIGKRGESSGTSDHQGFPGMWKEWRQLPRNPFSTASWPETSAQTSSKEKGQWPMAATQVQPLWWAAVFVRGPYPSFPASSYHLRTQWCVMRSLPGSTCLKWAWCSAVSGDWLQQGGLLRETDSEKEFPSPPFLSAHSRAASGVFRAGLALGKKRATCRRQKDWTIRRMHRCVVVTVWWKLKRGELLPWLCHQWQKGYGDW